MLEPQTAPSSTSSKARFVYVEPEGVRKNIHGPLLKKAIDRTDETSVNHVLQAIADGQMHLVEVWIGDELAGIMVLSHVEMPLKTLLCIFLIAGRWLDVCMDDGLRYCKDIAEDEGLDGLIAYCRPGLVPLLKERGWMVTSTVMELTC